MYRALILALCCPIVPATLFAWHPAMAQTGPVPGDEGAIQTYLAMWSRNADCVSACNNDPLIRVIGVQN